ncbi:DNase I-like protein [Tilletiopsis washingtonensis]|uniref:DNase I-like protein n=1 Tax=Tilletiopsis washingtonensis TaxID=58919 RepID=A0A316ZEK7_9BASI|nr:DNase I-like protein [Tilletiopsis washingtonensis]PWO00198.1 DNase I-like protein [Tilletiopsis washingtonensis]
MSSLRVQVATYNYNLRGLSSAPDFTPWLVPTLSAKSAAYVSGSNPLEGRPAPDIYAVGFQELLPLDVAFSSGAAAGQDAIASTDTAIRRAIRPQSAVTRSDGKYPPGGGPEDYALVARIQLVSIVLFVYARERSDSPGAKSIAQRVKEVRSATVGTGLLGLMGNKGAVGVRVVLEGAKRETDDEVLTFVCAHLAAHDHQVARRNRDWRNIVSRLVFTPSSLHALPPQQVVPVRSGGGAPNTEELKRQYEESKKGAGNKGLAALDGKEHGIYDSTHLFVFGDLNYRIAFNSAPAPHLARKGGEGEKLKKADVKRKVQQADWRTLAAYDQLLIERHHPSGARVFHGLTEPPLASAGFGPTYKYKIDKKKSAEELAKEKGEGVLSGKRVPGWTDRILWASVGAEEEEMHGVEVELYRSVMSYTISDHKPVTTLLRLPASRGTLLSRHAPYAIDASWRSKALVGRTLDGALGIVWRALVTAGAGNVVAGALEAVVVLLLAVWYLGNGGGDAGWWIPSLRA